LHRGAGEGLIDVGGAPYPRGRDARLDGGGVLAHRQTGSGT
jgi:hypothetical protein